MNYADFFNIYLERKTWGADVLKSDKIIKMVIANIKKGDMSLYSHNNTMTIKLPFTDLKIRLKAFNNYHNDPNQQGAAAVFKFDKNRNPLIELFVFETFKELQNFRGKSLDVLNRILLRIVEDKISRQLFINLSHELEHAFESDKGIDMFDLENSDNKKQKQSSMEEYYNEPAEVNARIVQFIYPINKIWSSDLDSGEWANKHQNPDEIKTELKQIIHNIPGKKYLTERNIKKVIKGVYTTLQYLWNHYNKMTNSKIRTSVQDRKIKEMIDNLK